MSGSTKGLLASLLVILGMVLGYVLLLTGQPDLVPLGLSANTRPEVRAQVVNYLQARSIPYQEFGTEISVPADRNYEVLGQLMNVNIIGHESIDFSTVFEQGSVFESRWISDKRYLAAKMKAVSLMLRMFDNVDRAEVLIDPAPRSGGIGSAMIASTAAVMVDTGGRGMSRTQALSIARLVAGAHSGLEAENVSVSEPSTGRSYLGAETSADVAQSARREYEESVEADYLAMVQSLIRHIPGARATINADVDLDMVSEWEQSFQDPKIAPVEERSRDFSTTRAPVQGDPGVRPNVGMSLASASSSETTESESRARNTTRFPGGVKSSQRAPGRVTAVRAIVKIPRSWFVGKWQSEQTDPTAVPDSSQIVTYSAPILQSFEDEVRTLLVDASTGTAGTAVASMYDDLTGESLRPAAPATSSLLGDLVGGGLVSTASVVLLAMVSLGLMFMLVRNASRSDEMPSAEELVGIPPRLETDDDVIGEVGDEPFALEGKEIDEDTVRREQILEYLNNFANEDSEEAAALLRRWLREDGV